MITVFDTETTGFWDFKAPSEDPRQPRLVQLGAILCTDDFRRVGHIDVVVKPDGFEIPESATKVHGITTNDALKFGVSRITTLAMFAQFTAISHTIMGWNCDYDSRVMGSEFLRCNLPKSPFSEKHKWRDLMKECTPVCKMPPTRPGQTEYKWPKLEEAHEFFFKTKMVGAHSALNDCFGTLKIAKELERLFPKEPKLL